MTKKEMLERIREINAERNKLAEEKQEYERLLEEERKQKKLDEYSKHVGEYYKASACLDSKYNFVKAFKIVSVLPEQNGYARCLVIVNGTRGNCWKESGIAEMTLPLWQPNQMRLMSNESDPKMLDFCTKIAEEEFQSLFQKHMEEMECLLKK